LASVDALEKQTINTIARAIGAGLYEQARVHADDDFLPIISAHKSDFVRCWAAEVAGNGAGDKAKRMLAAMKPFAKDGHFNVRECAWTVARKCIAKNLPESVAILSAWAKDMDENVRRFASEATRPRGVWREHIKELKENPELALPILEPLKSDGAKYVRDSLGSWLNDASKSRPDFVVNSCERIQRESDTKETCYIVKKALRTIAKRAT